MIEIVGRLKAVEYWIKVEPMTEATNERKSMQIGVNKIYIKDLSLESPSSPDIFFSNMQPQLGVDFQIQTKKFKDDLYEVVLKITLEAKEKDKEAVAFIIEIEQAGVFGISGTSDEELKTILHTFCPTQLFPYARQAIDTSLSMAGLPVVNLAPINFDGLYAQNQNKIQDS